MLYTSYGTYLYCVTLLVISSRMHRNEMTIPSRYIHRSKHGKNLLVGVVNVFIYNYIEKSPKVAKISAPNKWNCRVSGPM